jgi:hypothetical protein
VILTPQDGRGEVLVTRRARLRERMAARWRARSLDGQLARGVPPECAAALALRAHALGEPGMRKALARGVQLALDQSRCPGRPSLSRLRVRKYEVLAAADELDALVARLRGPGLLASPGLARVHLLLSDGRGPLYFRGELRTAVSRALEGLEPGRAPATRSPIRTSRHTAATKHAGEHSCSSAPTATSPPEPRYTGPTYPSDTYED